MTHRHCSTCKGDIVPIGPNPHRSAKVCLVCDGPDSALTITSLGGMDSPAPGAH